MVGFATCWLFLEGVGKGEGDGGSGGGGPGRDLVGSWNLGSRLLLPGTAGARGRPAADGSGLIMVNFWRAMGCVALYDAVLLELWWGKKMELVLQS